MSEYSLLFACLIILCVLWALLPFAIFGIKGHLQTLIKEQRETNRLLGANGAAQPRAARRADGAVV